MTSREARIRGRAKLSAELKSAIGRLGAAGRLAKVPRAQRLEQSRAGGLAYAARTSPERRREIGRKGVAALNAKLTPEQRRENGRKGGQEAARRRREAAERDLTDTLPKEQG